MYFGQFLLIVMPGQKLLGNWRVESIQPVYQCYSNRYSANLSGVNLAQSVLPYEHRVGEWQCMPSITHPKAEPCFPSGTWLYVDPLRSRFLVLFHLLWGCYYSFMKRKQNKCPTIFFYLNSESREHFLIIFWLFCPSLELHCNS